MYLIEKMLLLKKYKLTMNDEASSIYWFMFSSKGNLRSFKQSLHCHKLLVVVFLSPKKALKCVSTILLFNCGDL